MFMIVLLFGEGGTRSSEPFLSLIIIVIIIIKAAVVLGGVIVIFKILRIEIRWVAVGCLRWDASPIDTVDWFRLFWFKTADCGFVVTSNILE